MLNENSKVKVHMYSGKSEIKTRNHGRIFQVKKQNGKYGIDWNTEHSPYTCNGEAFTPFDTFSHSVIFEDVESGKHYHYSNISENMVELKEGN